jgi:hypothetical protein
VHPKALGQPTSYRMVPVLAIILAIAPLQTVPDAAFPLYPSKLSCATFTLREKATHSDTCNDHPFAAPVWEMVPTSLRVAVAADTGIMTTSRRRRLATTTTTTAAC